jgi:mandelate racemase
MKACDYAMPDFMRIGGVTGWQRAAAIAVAAGIPISPARTDLAQISI